MFLFFSSLPRHFRYISSFSLHLSPRLSLSVTSSSPSPSILSPLSPASFPHPHVDVQAREVTTIKPDPIHRRRADNLTETFFPRDLPPSIGRLCGCSYRIVYRDPRKKENSSRVLSFFFLQLFKHPRHGRAGAGEFSGMSLASGTKDEVASGDDGVEVVSCRG